MSNIFFDGRNKVRVITITVGDNAYDPSDLENMRRPTATNPFWMFNFKNGVSIAATGNVSVTCKKE